MKYTQSYDIIAKKVLNEKTGELEEKDFKEIAKTKKIKGGYVMLYYKDYEEIEEEVVKSNKDIKLLHWITNQFTSKRIEVPLVYSKCSVDISQPTFSKMIKKLLDLKYIIRIDRGIYRLNPFIYVPYHSDAEYLQEEWTELLKSKKDMI